MVDKKSATVSDDEFQDRLAVLERTGDLASIEGLRMEIAERIFSIGPFHPDFDGAMDRRSAIKACLARLTQNSAPPAPV